MNNQNVLLPLFLFSIATNSFAHHEADHAVVLHTNDRWEECAMVIDPSLTQADWRTFTKDVSSILYFRPTSGAKPLGKAKFEIAMELSRTEPLKDYNDSWNNTFSHPDATHWLTPDNHRLSVPVITARVGVNDKLDAGFLYTNNFGANYGWTGVDLKYAFYQNRDQGVFIATRVSAAMLIRVQDFDYYQGAVDLLASKQIGWFAPYAGVTGMYSIADIDTTKAKLKQERYASMAAIVGTQFQWRYLSVAAEADIARTNMYTFKIGASF